MLDELRQRFRGRTWVPVTLGCSGARVWRVDSLDVNTTSLYVKTTEHAHFGDRGESLAAEAGRLAWFATVGIPVAELVDSGSDEQFAWLITRALAGRTAADPWPEARRKAVIDALADIALTLHALPVAACPFDRTLGVSVPEARCAAASGRVDLDDLDAERAGWSAAQLFDALVATVPADEDPVVCHGDFCLPNVLLDPLNLAFAGLVDVGRAGLADRHADLALITRSIANKINDQFPSEYADRFIKRYETGSGVTVDPERMAFYRLLDEFA